MKLLLDTHTFIWFINGDECLSIKARKEILKASNSKFISIASIWEMAIKISLEKLNINYPFKEVFHQIQENGFVILPVIFEHTDLVSQLEFYHRDPFDRLLIAQAIWEEMTIISKDEKFLKYPVKTTW
ncbi:MAG TPA: type II toxin-antitoxin system VapC family toxin [Candidatus Kapabacteria bacterium]|nr:type II toxin-antitoxin system VapC family toxin [Candidatus Kapabacteria bacterium]